MWPGIADVTWHGAGARDVGGGTHGPIITVCRVGIAERRACSSVARGAMMQASSARRRGRWRRTRPPVHRCSGSRWDGGPLAHVEGEAVDLAEVAVEAGEVCKEARGWWRAARSVALPFAVDRAEGDSTQIGKSPARVIR